MRLVIASHKFKCIRVLCQKNFSLRSNRIPFRDFNPYFISKVNTYFISRHGSVQRSRTCQVRRSLSQLGSVYRLSALTRIVLSTINPHPDWPLARCLRASFGNWFVVLANFRRLLLPPHRLSPPLPYSKFSFQDPSKTVVGRKLCTFAGQLFIFIACSKDENAISARFSIVYNPWKVSRVVSLIFYVHKFSRFIYREKRIKYLQC